MKVGIIGLGLIGGSIALDLKKQGFSSGIVGCDLDQSNEAKALKLGLVDRVDSLSELCLQSDLIVLAIPVDAARKVIVSILNQIKGEAIVTDVGSSKEAITKITEAHPKGSQFVPGHPIAGTENSGPESAISGLFKGKLAILCPHSSTKKSAIDAVVRMYEILGSRIEMMNSVEHDKHLAYVSHLSHVSSFALGLTVLNIEKDERKIFDLAGSGFESTVRLAKSSAAMWEPILKTNKENILVALSEYIEQLNTFKELFEKDAFDEVRGKMIEANDIRRVLEGEQKENKKK